MNSTSLLLLGIFERDKGRAKRKINTFPQAEIKINFNTFYR